MTEESEQQITPPTSRMPAWRRKSLAYHWIITSLVESSSSYSNKIAEILTITNYEVRSCAEQINVVHPGYLKLTKIVVDGPLIVTELGLKLFKIDLAEHSEPRGGVLVDKFVNLFSEEFLIKGRENKWLDLMHKGKEVHVIPGHKSLDLTFLVSIAFEISRGFWVTEPSRNLAINHGLVVPYKKISAYLIEKGPNFPADRNQVSRTWLCMMNREKVLEKRGQISNFQK